MWRYNYSPRASALYKVIIDGYDYPGISGVEIEKVVAEWRIMDG